MLRLMSSKPIPEAPPHSIAGANQVISLQADGKENTYSVSTGYASASASLTYGFIIEGPAAPTTGVAVTFEGRGVTSSGGDPADNSVSLSVVESEADGSSAFTLLSQTSIGTESYLYTLFLYPGIQYEIDMEASVYTNGLNQGCLVLNGGAAVGG